MKTAVIRHGLVVLPYITTFILAYTFRGFFRALASHLQGDDTAKDYGFLTLNPAAHVNGPLTLIIMLITTILLFLGFDNNVIAMVFIFITLTFSQQWHIVAPVNSYNFPEKSREKSLAIVGAAGIASHYVLALALLYFYRIIELLSPFISENILPGAQYLVFQSLPWAIFLSFMSAIPIPFTDGFLVLEYFCPDTAEWIDENFTPPVMLLFIFALVIALSTPFVSNCLFLSQKLIIDFLSIFVFL